MAAESSQERSVAGKHLRHAKHYVMHYVKRYGMHHAMHYVTHHVMHYVMHHVMHRVTRCVMHHVMRYSMRYVMHVHVHVTCRRLHAVVERVGHDDAAVTRHGQAFGAVELALLAALAADAVAAAQARIVTVA